MTSPNANTLLFQFQITLAEMRGWPAAQVTALFAGLAQVALAYGGEPPTAEGPPGPTPSNPPEADNPPPGT